MNIRRVMLGAAIGCAVFLAACGDDPMGDPTPSLLERAAGNGQTGAPGLVLPVSYAVRVLD